MNLLFKINDKIFSIIFVIFILIMPNAWTKNNVLAVEPKLDNKQQIKSNKVGQFILEYEPSSSKRYIDYEIPSILSNQEIRQFLIESKIFDTIVSDLNNSGLVMRENVPVVLTECGTANAFWVPDKKMIIICYENMALDLILFHNMAKYPVQEAVKKSVNETIFAFYHELGHALMDVLPLNAVGQEEDTVDEFASVMLFQEYTPDSAAQIVLDSSEFYELLYKLGHRGSGWDEHAPNDKRLFNLVCFVYGSNPAKYKDLFIKKVLSVHPNQQISQDELEYLMQSANDRAKRCEKEFPQKVAMWNRLLLPHFASQNINKPPQRTPNNSPGVSRRGTHW